MGIIFYYLAYGSRELEYFNYACMCIAVTSKFLSEVLVPNMHLNLMQIRVYDLESMSCAYVLTGHTEIVLSLDTCVLTSGRTLIVTGSKDNTVSFLSF